jgi:hypothetical protein
MITLRLVVVQIYLLYGNIQGQSFALQKKPCICKVCWRESQAWYFIEQVLGAVASSCWGCFLWFCVVQEGAQGRERMLWTLAFFLTTATSWHHAYLRRRAEVVGRGELELLSF